MGHEGQGLSASLMQRADQHIRIIQTHGQESLNVAVAASICVYSSAIMFPKTPQPLRDGDMG
jgi:TrmH family RNA methyltransferase